MVRFQPPQLIWDFRFRISDLKGGAIADLRPSDPKFEIPIRNVTGSWSNRKTPVLQTGDSGAIPDGSTSRRRKGRRGQRGRKGARANFSSTLRLGVRSRGPAAATPGLQPGNDGSSPSGINLGSRLGRQSADHPRLERRMLWVQLPPEPLTDDMSSQSSPECSPPCQGGDRGFKSRRGRL